MRLLHSQPETHIPNPFYIAGATGVGKSAVATALAERIGGEIVNADAFQLYEGMDILTAKPGTEDLARVPHHLYGVIDLSDEFDVAKYEALAKPRLAEIAAGGRTPIVTGGSGLYLKSLTHGLSPVPSSDPKLRAELEAQELPVLASRLSALDPAGAESTNLLNKRYVIRALEICLQSGRPMSEIKNEWESAAPAFDGILLNRDRQELYARINQRTIAMLDEGLLDEVASLPEEISATAEKAIGIREARLHNAGEISREECIEMIQTSTRRYAKRQVTWFRREKGFQSIELPSDASTESTVETILELFPHLT